MSRNADIDFPEALGKHLGLKNLVGAQVEAGVHGCFFADVRICIWPDDMAAISALMGGKALTTEHEPVSAHFDPPATDDDLARFMRVDGKNYLVVNVSPPDGATAKEFAGLAANQLSRAMKRNP